MDVRTQHQFREMTPREFLHATLQDVYAAEQQAPNHQTFDWYDYKMLVRRLIRETPE